MKKKRESLLQSGVNEVLVLDGHALKNYVEAQVVPAECVESCLPPDFDAANSVLIVTMLNDKFLSETIITSTDGLSDELIRQFGENLIIKIDLNS